jgi:hypothetical protein
MLGAEVAVTEAARLLERPRDDLARGIVEVLRPGEGSVDEALVRGLLCHAERQADLRPGAPVGACGLDVAIEQRLAEPAQLVRGRRCGLDAR